MPSPKPPRRALVIAMRYLGDVLLATPLVHALRDRYPDCKVDMLVLEGTQAMLEGNPDIDVVHALPARPDRHTLLAMLRKVWRRYDIAIVMQPGDKPHLLGWAAARVRYGLVPEKLGRAWWKRLTVRRPLIADTPVHRILEGEAIARVMGLGPARTLVPPSAGMTSLDWQAMDFGGARFDPDQPYVIVHPSPRWRYKQWHRAGWHAVLDFLANRGLQIVVTGGPGKEESAYLDELLQDLPIRTANALRRAQGKLSLAQTADLLRRARLYVGPDTGTTHLAAACGTPSVTLFGPTNPTQWGPWPRGGLDPLWNKAQALQRRGHVIMLQNTAHACVPCQEEGCDRHRNSAAACLDTLPADAACAAIAALLDPAPPPAEAVPS